MEGRATNFKSPMISFFRLFLLLKIDNIRLAIKGSCRSRGPVQRMENVLEFGWHDEMVEVVQDASDKLVQKMIKHHRTHLSKLAIQNQTDFSVQETTRHHRIYISYYQRELQLRSGIHHTRVLTQPLWKLCTHHRLPPTPRKEIELDQIATRQQMSELFQMSGCFLLFKVRM